MFQRNQVQTMQQQGQATGGWSNNNGAQQPPQNTFGQAPAQGGFQQHQQQGGFNQQGSMQQGGMSQQGMGMQQPPSMRPVTAT